MLRQDFAVYQSQVKDGVRIEIAASLMLLAFVMTVAFDSVSRFIENFAVLIIILACLHLREMARSWVVRVQGLTQEAIVLSGSGGGSIHTSGTDEQEELIAAIGPLTSFALWGLTNLVLLGVPDGEARHWVEVFAFVNLFIGVFTALPVMPLDGGRFLHLYLGRSVGPNMANRTLGFTGLIISVLWLPACLLALLVTGMILIAVPSLHEHWEMLKGADPHSD